MPETYPTDLSTFRVVGRFVRGVADATDDDQDPDVVPIAAAKITFTPSLNPPIFRIPGAAEPITVYQESIVATTDADGYLKVANDPNPGVILPWGLDPDIVPTGWTWSVVIDPIGNFPKRVFSIAGTPGEVINLATVVPVASNPGTEIALWQAAVNEVNAAVLLAQAAAEAAANSAPVKSVNGDTGDVTITLADLDGAPSGAYVKPEGGIPETDLTDSAQVKLSLANSEGSANNPHTSKTATRNANLTVNWWRYVGVAGTDDPTNWTPADMWINS